MSENRAFLEFSGHFKNEGIAVPEIYIVNEDKTCYIQEDLGSLTLFDYLSRTRETEGFSEKIIAVYKRRNNFV